jgi:hypothetical protein
MWVPGSWSDIEALVGKAEETASLDFKRAISKNSREVAKDIAAMTVDGGVLLYGVDEDASTRLASAITKVPLAGQEERLRQITGSNIRPTPAVEVRALTETAGDTHGVIVLAVPRSALAPHEVDGTFPRRSGTTTARLTEPEIERLYQLRRHASGPLSSADDLLAPLHELPGLDDGEDYATGMGLDIGTLRLACRFDGDQRHPSDPWMRDALDRAVYRADAWFHKHPLSREPFLLERLNIEWAPCGVDGWSAGYATTDGPTLWTKMTAAAVFLYPSHLLIQVTFPLKRSILDDTAIDYRCAHEQLVARELVAALRLAGHLFNDYEAAGRFQVAAQVTGFTGAVPYGSSRARPGVDVSRFAPASDGVVSTRECSPGELLSSPADVAQELIGRWLAGFYVAPDLFDNLRG